MKSNAILRIVIYSVVILLLTGILLTGLGVGSLTFSLDFGTGNYIEGSGSVYASQISKIRIEWAAGKINIATADTDTITFSEAGTGDQEMVYEINGETLTILYSKPAIQVGFISLGDKDLTITVPRDWQCRELGIDAASADIQISSLTAEEMNLSTASGECDFTNCNIESLDIDTASGSIHYTGSLNKLDCDAASANFTATFTNVPQRLTMDSASGDLDITLPESCGFRVTMDALSGKFSSDFPADHKDNGYTYGDESCVIDFDGLSGSVRIRKSN